MEFPVELLPNSQRKIISGDTSQFLLIRHFRAKEGTEIINPATGLIEEECICSPRKQINDLSVNLLGVFTFDHLSLQLTAAGKETYNHYCEPDTGVEVPRFGEHFESVEGRKA